MSALALVAGGADTPLAPVWTPRADRCGTATAAIPRWRRSDDKGREIEQAWFGRDGKPLVADSGNTKVTSRYDSRGEVREKSYWILNERGNYVLRRRTDFADRTLEQAYFTPEGRPTLHKEGHHRETRTYDTRGNWTEQAYFDEQGRPMVNRHGIAREVSVYDDSKREISRSWFDAAGKPKVHKEFGDAKRTWEYDSKGNLRQRCYFVPDGKGSCVLRRRADAAYRTLEYAYFTPDGRPTLHKDGYHRWTALYDERGKAVEVASFGLNGKPCLCKEGYHRETRTYDTRGNWTEQAYFDEQGRPMVNRHGVAREVSVYDDRDREISRSWFDAAGKPKVHKEFGDAKLTWDYDSKGKLRQSCYFVPNGKGGCVLRRRADATDRTLEEASFSPEGRPTLAKDGYHRWTGRYDERGRLVATAVFDVTGQRLRCRILVGKVSPGSLAARAGLRKGDVLLRYGGKELTTAALFFGLRDDEGSGGPPRKLDLLRQGKPLSVELPPGEAGITLLNKAGPPEVRP